MNICVLIPVYNERKTIGHLVKTIKEKNLDVIVIDDGSEDESGDIAMSCGVIVIKHQKKCGKGYSLKEGFQHILKNGFDAVIMMDGDGQHDPGDINQFVKMAQRFPQSIITGNRMHNTQGMPVIRYLTNQFMSWLISCACRQNIPDTQCGFRYIHQSILKQLNLQCNDFEIETEILMKASKKGFPIYFVPIQTIYRDERSYISPLRDTIRFITYFLREITAKV